MAVHPVWFVPNVLCYVRLVLALALPALHVAALPHAVVALYAVAGLLDYLDGLLARVLHQTSRLGEALDVVADNACRTAMWVCAAQQLPWLAPAAVGVVSMEWITFACAHANSVLSAQHWKATPLVRSQPALIRAIFRNGFKNPLGFMAIGGIFCLPVALYAQSTVSLGWPTAAAAPVLGCLVSARALGLAAEAWVIREYAARLCEAGKGAQ